MHSYSACAKLKNNLEIIQMILQEGKYGINRNLPEKRAASKNSYPQPGKTITVGSPKEKEYTISSSKTMSKKQNQSMRTIRVDTRS